MAAAAIEAASAASRFGTEIGHQIFVYNQINTRQVVYSLTRVMNNNKALKQLLFVGKKSVPSSLRKDLWTPLCVLSFPHALQGLSAYKQLREFKHLHTVSWKRDYMKDPAGALLNKTEKTKKLQDEKANCIADMAHVLSSQAILPSEEQLRHARLMVDAEGVKNRGTPVGKYSPGKKQTAEVLEFQGKVDGVSIWWTDPLDAEYAKSWPEKVRHGPLAVHRYSMVWPPPEEILLGRKGTGAEATTA